MISNYLFALMAKDDTDSTAATVLPDIKRRMHLPELTEEQVPRFCYTSLKTLLGESGNVGVNEDGIPEWAVTRIWDYSENTKLRRIVDPREFPIVHLAVSNILQDRKAQRPGRITATINILVQTDRREQDASAAWNIIQRINSLFITYTAGDGLQTPKNIAADVTGIVGLLELYAFQQGMPVSSWDTQRVSYNAQAVMVQ